MKSIVISMIAAAGLMVAGSAMAVDMPDLAKKSGCVACHKIEGKLVGPGWTDIAKKYKGKEAEGEVKMIKHMTTGPKVKLEDGTEEDHKIIDTKDPKELSNLAQWILSL